MIGSRFCGSKFVVLFFFLMLSSCSMSEEASS